ncbi:unnamed protein product [Phytophthora fragariaefolia]|uniref:Unnamed protein product n=1 Tax=Phytophthora fragariaefolia TaxID=1490495 RepID=A0A9W6WYA0_9STRA|nr:unnamed protein product [Phytophthora fragariaefolia]
MQRLGRRLRHHREAGASLRLRRSSPLLTAARTQRQAYDAFEKAKQLLDGDDLLQAMGFLGVAAHANIADAQYLLGSLLLSEDDEEQEDETQRKANELIRDAEANRQRSGHADDPKNMKEIRKSARAAYKQYLVEQKRKKQAKAARAAGTASLVQHATTTELDRAFGKTVELLLDPQSKLEPLSEHGEDHHAAKSQLDTTKAVEWLGRAADNSNRDAHVQLGNLCLSHDPPMALEASAWYTRVTKDENPHPDALYNLGVMLFEGVQHAEPPFPGNKSAAIPFFTRAAEVGDESAQFFMGMLLHQGDKDLEIQPNFTSGLMLIETAANKDHPGALFYLAQLYRSGDEANKFPANRDKFLETLDKAMQAGEADAFFCMADIYFHGSDGFAQDYEQARGFYMAAAEQGHADAFCCLGALYYNGIGVEQDFKKAFLYYQEAADRDSMEAWKNLAEMYTVGRGVPRNEATANAIIKMLKKAQAEEDTFDLDVDNWGILSNGVGDDSRPHFQPISRGVQLSYYIYGLDAVIHRRDDTGDDTRLWYFTAPPKFLGNQWAAYGGSLDFVLSSAEGSFDASNLNLAGSGHLVELECATCAQFSGITLAMPLSPVFSYDGTTTQFSLPLNELAGWVKDPKNIILSWGAPLQCEFVNVLSGLSAIRILGDFTRGYESVALDTVTLRHGPGQPVKCYT